MSKNMTIGLIYVLVGLFIIFLVYNFYQSSLKSDSPMISDYKKDVTNIKTIQIDSNITGITISESDDEYFYALLETLSISQNNQYTLRVYEQDPSKLEIRIEKPKKFLSFINTRFNETKLEIKVPKHYKGALVIDSETGGITVNAITVNQLQAKTSTGGVKLNSVNGDEITLKSSTGSIHLNQVVADMLSANSTTGSIHIDSQIAKLDAETTTGSIHVTQDDIRKDTRLSSTTGSIHVTLHEVPQSLHVTFNTSVGGYHINKSGYNAIENSKKKMEFQYGTGDIKLDVNTTTGSFHFN